MTLLWVECWKFWYSSCRASIIAQTLNRTIFIIRYYTTYLYSIEPPFRLIYPVDRSVTGWGETLTIEMLM